MSSIEPPSPERTRRSFGRLIGFVAALIVVVVVFGVLLFHFAGGSGPKGGTGSNVSSPGPAQPGPTFSPTPGVHR